MFRHLLLKEIKESLISFRFQLTFLICLTLIPLSFYLGADTYNSRKAHIDELQRLYVDQNEGNIRYNLMAEGYRPPSPLSLFCTGLEDYLPDKVITSRDGNYSFERKWGVNNPVSLLTGKIDFLFIIAYIMPLLVFALTSNTVSSEKENGTLRLILANGISRWKLIAAKVMGPFALISICYLTGIVLGILLLRILHTSIDFSNGIVGHMLVIFLLTLLFLFTLVNIGVFISILSKNTFLSMITGLLVYVAFSLIIPKLSPMLAQIIYPVKSLQVHNTEMDISRNEIITRRENEKRKVMHDLKAGLGLPQSLSDLRHSPEQREIYENKVVPAYEEEVARIDESYGNELALTMKSIEDEYLGKTNTQQRIALNISRLSPISSLIILISELSSTGFGELDNFRQQSGKFQDFVRTELYDKVIVQRYYDSGGYRTSADYLKDIDQLPVPVIENYKYRGAKAALLDNWIDILLISVFGILFFAASFTGFIRYDVR
jgi:ABC-2 type transport system permease protein